MSEVKSYIDNCVQKINFHRNQVTQARSWNNAISLVTVALASLQAFLMTLLTVINADALTIALTSGIFSLVIIISSKVKENYQFLALSYQHENLCNEFTALHYNFLLSKTKYETDDFDTLKYEKNIIRYSNILARSHIQQVSDCRSIFCCISGPRPELL